MIKPILHKPLNVTLAVLLLFSTTSFVVEKHFCTNMLVDSAVFTKVKKCGGLEDVCATLSNCCSDEQIVISGQDELSINNSFQLKNIEFVELQLTNKSVCNLYQSITKKIAQFYNYVPPNIIVDIQSQLQTYLI